MKKTAEAQLVHPDHYLHPEDILTFAANYLREVRSDPTADPDKVQLVSRYKEVVDQAINDHKHHLELARMIAYAELQEHAKGERDDQGPLQSFYDALSSALSEPTRGRRIVEFFHSQTDEEEVPF